MSARLQHVLDLIQRVSVGHTRYPFKFRADRVGAQYNLIQVWIEAVRPCNLSGVLDEQIGRPWLIQGQDSDDAILNTLLLAVLTFEEHEIREGFKFDGKALYEPKH